MNNDKHKHSMSPQHAKRIEDAKSGQYVIRDRVLGLLSEAEVAGVSAAEMALLAPGDEYVDLQHLERGVCTAGDKVAAPVVERALPRKAVGEATWNKILSTLSPKQQLI